MNKVLGIGGSPRKGGNSDILLQRLLKGARDEGAATEEVLLRDYQFQPCIGCERCRKDKRCTGLQDGMQLIYPKILEAGGMVVISPI
jgi:multimeric flavodoxin WrbA